MKTKWEVLPDAERYHRPLDVEYLRALLEAAGLTQRGAAKVLGVSERIMRYYCSGEVPIPYTVQYALEVLAAHNGGNKR